RGGPAATGAAAQRAAARAVAHRARGTGAATGDREDAMIRGTTRLVAHLGDPIAPVKAPMIYNPYFEHKAIDAVVVPMGVTRDDSPATLRAMFRVTNMLGAVVTMPHKRSTVDLLDDCSPRVRMAGSCNAIVRRPDGTLFGDVFDGLGFVRALLRNRFE